MAQLGFLILNINNGSYDSPIEEKYRRPEVRRGITPDHESSSSEESYAEESAPQAGRTVYMGNRVSYYDTYRPFIEYDEPN